MSTNEKLTPGMVLGRYELLLPIAQGGMATVWAARQKGSRGFQKTVAIKTMLPNLSDDPMFEQMFLDEAALAAKIHHPNVAEILDLGEQDEIIYLVMEWVDGEALSVLHKVARKNQVQFPIRIAVRVAIQACAGLHAAHELRDENDVPLQLVHRDVSPQNILVTYDGISKLVDFGVAKAANRASGETSAGQLKGKVPYMSPEQARGGVVDRRTDIFAMGIVLYKLTTGLHPFLGENDLVTMRNIISRPLLPPRVKNPAFPQELDQVLVKCLSKDPEKRYQTMLELGGALERALAAMGMADDDVGAFMRGQLGERGAKRRSAIRDAVRMADERIATGIPVAPPSQNPTVHENLSEIVMTQMNSAVNKELLSDRISAITVAEPGRASSSSAIPPTQMSEQSPTYGVEVAGFRKKRSGLFVGVGIAAVAGLIVFAALQLRSGGTPPPAPTGTLAAAPPKATAATQAAPPPTAEPHDAPPSVSGSASALSVNDLPNADDKKKSPGASGKGAQAEPKTSPSGAPSAGKSTRPVSTQWVPTVQNPGF